ncbi:Membrane protein, partial [Globisporangium splendens]
MLAASRSALWHRAVAVGARGPACHAPLPQFLLRGTSASVLAPFATIALAQRANAMRISTAIVKTSNASAKRSTAMTTRFSTSAGSSSSSHSASAGAQNAVAAAKEKSMSHFERLKDLWRKYGIVAIGTYFSMYGIVLGSIYVAIDQGWVSTAKTSRDSDSEDADNNDFNVVTATNKYGFVYTVTLRLMSFVTLAEDLGIAKYLEVERVNAKTGTFLLAWIATKFTEPVRLAVTLAITPRIARFLRRAPPKP